MELLIIGILLFVVGILVSVIFSMNGYYKLGTLVGVPFSSAGGAIIGIQTVQSLGF